MHNNGCAVCLIHAHKKGMTLKWYSVWMFLGKRPSLSHVPLVTLTSFPFRRSCIKICAMFCLGGCRADPF